MLLYIATDPLNQLVAGGSVGRLNGIAGEENKIVERVSQLYCILGKDDAFAAFYQNFPVAGVRNGLVIRAQDGVQLLCEEKAEDRKCHGGVCSIFVKDPAQYGLSSGRVPFPDGVKELLVVFFPAGLKGFGLLLVIGDS